MNFKIHRGTKEIGSSSVEIWSEATQQTYPNIFYNEVNSQIKF